MKPNRLCVAAVACATLVVGFLLGRHDQSAAKAAGPEFGGSDAAEVARLREQVKRLEGLAPDQAAVMSHVGYHFANLWVAVDQENWPLADFYLGETRSNIKWAVRAKPVRKDAGGKDFDLAPVAEAIDNTQFVQLKQAIDARQKDRFKEAYGQTLAACYGCHKASNKPYLRPRVPTAPEAPVINFDPNATTP